MPGRLLEVDDSAAAGSAPCSSPDAGERREGGGDKRVESGTAFGLLRGGLSTLLMMGGDALTAGMFD